MARRSRNTESNTEAQEATVTEPTTEAPEQATEAAPEVEINLDAFKTAVETAVAEKDSATGEVAPVFIDPVVKAYRDLDGLKAKNAAKKLVSDAMKESMNEMDIQTARAYLTLQDNLTAGSGSSGKAEKAPADPTENFVQRYAGLRLALDLVGGNVPEGVAEDWADKAKALYDESKESASSFVAWLASDEESRGDEPEVSAFVKSAVKLSQGKAAKVGSKGTGTPYTGERRDIAKHIQSAFAEVNEGDFLTVAEIKNHKSEEYGDNPPSAGAVSARLFPPSGKCTVEGVEPGTNEKGHKGAKKVA